MTGRITEQELSTELNKKIESDKFPVATEAEAKAGQSDERYMTPLKVKQATPKNVPDGFAGLDDKGKIPASLFPNTPLVKVREVDIVAQGLQGGVILNDFLQYKRIVLKGRDLEQLDNTVAGGMLIRYNDLAAAYTYATYNIGASSGQSGNQISAFSGNSAQTAMEFDIDIDNTHKNYRTDILVIHSTPSAFIQSVSRIIAGTVAKQNTQINKMGIYARDPAGNIGRWSAGKIEVWAELR